MAALGLLMLAAALGVGVSEACMCMPAHPQEQYCRAHFAVLAKVMSSRREGPTRRYEVAVMRTYKGGAEARALLKAAGVVSAASDSLCGAELQEGVGYLLTGRVRDGQPRVSLCDAPTPWRSLTVRQRKGLHQQYGHSCGCQPGECPWWGGPEAVRDCLVSHSVCTPDHRHRNQRCNWLRGRALDGCLKKAGVRNVAGEHAWWAGRGRAGRAGRARAEAVDKPDRGREDP